MKFGGMFLLLPILLLGQPEFFGYFESEASTMQLGDNNYSFGFNKFRLDVEARPNDHVLIGANVNIQRYWGQTLWNVYDFLPGYSSYGLVNNIELTDTLLIDNFYMRMTFSRFDLTVGRQQISPGVGYAWNPTDIFNTKSLLDPSYEQTGVPAIRIEIPVSPRLSLNSIIQPGDDWGASTKQLWLKAGLGRFDVGITLAELQQSTPASIFFGDAFDVKRTLTGGSVVGELFEWGIWFEGAQNTLDTLVSISPLGPAASHDPLSIQINKTYLEYVIGVDHTFDNSIYLLVEVFHNGFGIKNKSELGLQDYFYTLSGDGTSLMQDYAFFYAMHPTFDFVTPSMLVIANFNDNSGTFAPQLDWNVFEDTNISLQGSLFWGKDDTEFGLHDWGLRLRIRSDF